MTAFDALAAQVCADRPAGVGLVGQEAAGPDRSRPMQPWRGGADDDAPWPSGRYGTTSRACSRKHRPAMPMTAGRESRKPPSSGSSTEGVGATCLIRSGRQGVATATVMPLGEGSTHSTPKPGTEWMSSRRSVPRPALPAQLGLGQHVGQAGGQAVTVDRVQCLPIGLAGKSRADPGRGIASGRPRREVLSDAGGHTSSAQPRLGHSHEHWSYVRPPEHAGRLAKWHPGLYRPYILGLRSCGEPPHPRTYSDRWPSPHVPSDPVRTGEQASSKLDNLATPSS